jgi:GTP-binding protein EngB required for normal cell division
MDERSYHGKRADLARGLDELIKLVHADRETCTWLKAKLNEETFNLVAAGQFKRGKSSVINALIGHAVLPVGVIPLTSVVTVLRYGPAPAATIFFEAGEEREVEIDALADYVTESRNPRNVKGVREVVVTFPSAWLESGVRLVDTPGIGSVYEHNSDVAQRYMPQADAVLFVASVDQPMSRAEIDFLDSIRPYAGKVFCLLNKIDYLSAEDVRESLAFSRQAVEASLGVAAPIYPVSAKLALEQKCGGQIGASMASGFQVFETALREFMTDERDLIWLHSLANNGLRVIAQARLRTDLELAALSVPLDKIQENLAAFSQKKQEVLQARSDYRTLLESNVKDLLKVDIEPGLERFKREERQRIIGFIDDWSHELRALSSRQFQDALEGKLSHEIRSAYDEWLAVEEPKVAQAFDRICSRYWSDIQNTINDLLSYSAALFSVQFDAPAQASLWAQNSTFSYKFWHEPVGLQTLTSSIVLALPKRIGERLIMGRMQKRAVDLVEIHAGRIRHDFEERLKRNVASFANQLLSRIESTVGGIESAIDSGIDMRDRGEVLANGRRAELESSRQTVSALERRFGAIVVPSVEADHAA